MLAVGELVGGAVMPQTTQIQLQWWNNYRSPSLCAYLSSGGCQPVQPQRFTVQCISLNLWNSWCTSWRDCSLLHLARLSQNRYLCWLSAHCSLNLRMRLCLKNPVAFEQVYFSSSWLWTTFYAGNSRATLITCVNVPLGVTTGILLSKHA